jgi:hypothetical protein
MEVRAEEWDARDGGASSRVLDPGADVVVAAGEKSLVGSIVTVDGAIVR